jgi:hypothetical protein
MQKTVARTSIVVLLVLTSFAACSTVVGSNAVARYNQNPLTVPIPAGLSEAQIESAMKETLVTRGWELGATSPQQTDGTLHHRSFKATVSLVANNGSIRILSYSQYVPEGEAPQPGVPKGWLVNLQKDLTRRLAVASPQP